jgi:hypothetical protein
VLFAVQSYMALGLTLATQEGDVEKMKASTRDKGAAMLQRALELSDAYTQARGGPSGEVPLSRERYAETSYLLGHLLSATNAKAAMLRFSEAVKLAPTVQRYATAQRELMKGADEYRRQQRQQAADEEKARLKRLEEEEDAAWEEDGLEF